MGFPKGRKEAARVVLRSARQTVAGVSAEDALDELTRIHASAGLSAKAVVDESRPDDAVLHPVFEWDDEVAGERYREHQATTLIRSVRIVVDPADETGSVTEPAFINVSQAGQPGVYEPPSTVAESVSYLAMATENAMRELRSAQMALEDLKVIADGRGDDRATLIVAAIASLGVARDAISKFH
jgi:uncharacterized protein YfiM (DUF2279 family)